MGEPERNEQGINLIFFFPYIPYPPEFGSHVRCLEILSGLSNLGCKITFLGIRNYRESDHEKERIRQTVAFLNKTGIKKIELYTIGFFEYLMIRLIRAFYLVLGRAPPANPLRYFSWNIRSWFRKIQSETRPDILWMNYAHWAFLADRRDSGRTLFILENHDLITLNNAMQFAINQCLTRDVPFTVRDRKVLSECFFTDNPFPADPAELRIITSYDRVVAISQKEAEIFRQFNNGIAVFHVPMTCSPVNCDNTYSAPPVFATGPNQFNVQGYLYLAEKVLPRILEKNPEFSLTVTGSCCERVQPCKGVTLAGFVKNLSEIYCNSRFAICPVLGGTGQQIKIIEAMAHGLPVVVTHYSAMTSPVVHGYNGFVAENAEEFARHCITLWQNPLLCREMGDAARKTIRQNYSETMLQERLSHVIAR